MQPWSTASNSFICLPLVAGLAPSREAACDSTLGHVVCVRDVGPLLGVPNLHESSGSGVVGFKHLFLAYQCQGTHASCTVSMTSSVAMHHVDLLPDGKSGGWSLRDTPKVLQVNSTSVHVRGSFQADRGMHSPADGTVYFREIRMCWWMPYFANQSHP